MVRPQRNYSSMHTGALSFLRFQLNLPLVCTEVGRWSADVWGASKTRLVEVEIKKTLSDLKAEFRNKKVKLSFYRNAGKYSTTDIPKHFYYYIPEAMVEKATPLIVEEFPEAGILVNMEDVQDVVARRPKALHNNPPTDRTLNTMMLRMSSQIYSLHSALDRVIYTQAEYLQDALTDHLNHTSFLYGADICVEEGKEVSPRITTLAMRIALAMDGVSEDDWPSLSTEGKARYIDGARKLAVDTKEDFSEAIKK